MRILFAGTPMIAVPTLCALNRHFEIGAVLTNPDRPQKRKASLVFSPVKEQALTLGLPVLQFEHLGSKERGMIQEYHCDTLVCFAYGKFFGPKFLSLFPYAQLNIHPSLLPELRGPSPIQGAILKELDQTGISLQAIASEMDSGAIAAVTRFPLDGTETVDSLTEKVSQLAASLAVDTLSRPLVFTPQRGEPSYTRMVSHQDGIINWGQSAHSINAQVRGMYPWPKASTVYKGEVLFICAVDKDCSQPVPPGFSCGSVVARDKKKGVAIATSEGLLWVTRLQRQMKNEMDALAFVNGDNAFLTAKLG
ncbi:MAG: methionyl-tRNA formyltransferase [Sphaerochaetaceae bacterium]